MFANNKVLDWASGYDCCCITDDEIIKESIFILTYDYLYHNFNNDNQTMISYEDNAFLHLKNNCQIKVDHVC